MGILNDSTIRRTLIVSTGLLCASLQGFASLEKTTTIPITEQVRTKIQLSGIVTDKEGTPLIGATIQEKESGNGTITDYDGKFTLSVSSDATIIVSYIGYQSRQLVINGKKELTIILEED